MVVVAAVVVVALLVLFCCGLSFALQDALCRDAVQFAASVLVSRFITKEELVRALPCVPCVPCVPARASVLPCARPTRALLSAGRQRTRRYIPPSPARGEQRCCCCYDVRVHAAPGARRAP